MRNTKRELPLFSMYDHTGMERHLEEMAVQGWVLKKPPVSAGSTGGARHGASAMPSPISRRPLPMNRVPVRTSRFFRTIVLKPDGS